MNYSNIHEVVGWISGSVKSYRHDICTADDAINDIEEAILKYTKARDETIDQLKKDLKGGNDE